MTNNMQLLGQPLYTDRRGVLWGGGLWDYGEKRSGESWVLLVGGRYSLMLSIFNDFREKHNTVFYSLFDRVELGQAKGSR